MGSTHTNFAHFGVKVSDKLLGCPCWVVSVVDIDDSEADGLDGLEPVVDDNALDKLALELVQDHLCLANRLFAPCPGLCIHQENEALWVRL